MVQYIYDESNCNNIEYNLFSIILIIQSIHKQANFLFHWHFSNLMENSLKKDEKRKKKKRRKKTQ